MTKIICIACPRGCYILADKRHNITGNYCLKGAEYAREELQNPVRNISSTVKIEGAIHRRCPVKTQNPIPKPLIFEAMKLLENINLKAPVKEGQIIVENICNTGIPWITTRDM